MSGQSIGNVAKRAGVGVETVRFYERQGLIDRPARPDGGFRQYSDDVVDRIRFIRHAKELGFTLSEIGDLLSLRADPRVNCETVQHRAEEKMADVDSKIRALRKIKTQLQRLARACENREATAECPILEALR